MKEERILFAINDTDDEYLMEAAPQKRSFRLPTRTIAIAASIALIIGLSVAFILSGAKGFISNSPGGGNDTPFIPDDLYAHLGAGENYERLIAIIDKYNTNPGSIIDRNSIMEDMTPNDSDTPPPSVDESLSNGSYVSISTNQEENVEEPDTIKMTYKYIFHIGGLKNGGQALRIYTVDGKNSKQMCEYPIPYFDGSKYSVGAKMLLSRDGKTVTVIKSYTPDNDPNGVYKTVVMTLDVSDVTSPSLVKAIFFNGISSITRSSNSKFIIGTEFLATRLNFKWDDPSIYLPYYQQDDEKIYLDANDILCPDEIHKRNYTSYYLLDESLNLLSAKSVFGLSGGGYVSDDKIIVYGAYAKTEDSSKSTIDCKTDIAVIDYSSDSLKFCSMLTVDGWVEDRFFLDEKDNKLRIVTNDFKSESKFILSPIGTSIYVYDLISRKEIASVIDFAPDGEMATAVYFEGDKLYVCSAEVKSYVDPVFFFDLSDYNNITQSNTGFIDGFSSTLIPIKNGYLLGIGPKDARTNKVSIYKKQGDEVITVAEYEFKGAHATNRKAFLIDAERGLFGFATHSYRDENGIEQKGSYILLHFNGRSLMEVAKLENNHNAKSLRSVYINGYLYIVKNTAMVVEKIKGIF